MTTNSQAHPTPNRAVPVPLRAAVIVPTYNEAENIVRLVPDLLALPDGLSLIVVDAASPDGTGALVIHSRVIFRTASSPSIDRPNSVWARRIWLAFGRRVSRV